MSVRRFPRGFWWGTATASYQIEGAVREQGRRPSIWDTFSRKPGAVLNGDTGDVAIDHYHRWESDLDIIASLGVNAYRFSVAWPRVIPLGRGEVNAAGLDFYDRLIDGLLERGIAPLVTLYHWDLPQALEDVGGWPSRATAYAFEAYTDAVVSRLGDRVALWSTLNEPWCSAFLGYAAGVHAPGGRDPVAALTAAHHLNLAHGLAGRVIRERAPGVPLSVSLNVHAVRPATTDPVDVDAARRIDAVGNRIFLDPMLGRGYPPDLLADTALLTDWGFVHDHDESLIGVGADVLGVNYYTPTVVRALGEGEESSGNGGHGVGAGSPWPGANRVGFVDPPGPVTAMGWQVDASALSDLLLRLYSDYRVPLLITENGSAWVDTVGQDGAVRDDERVSYLVDHLVATHEALLAGAVVQGYCAWSAFDNFEWAYGYSKRFGLAFVDYSTQERTLKSSARVFAAVAASGEIPPGETTKR